MGMMMHRFALSLLVMTSLSIPALAQTTAPADATKTDVAPPAEQVPSVVEKPVSQADFIRALNQELNAQAKAPVYTPPGVPSLFFSPLDYARLQEARAGFAVQKDDLNIDDMLQTSPLGPREVSLQGIVYRGPKDWVIWLNKEQMTPDKLPLEILDIKVGREFVELRWFDRATNKTYPIRLRPNQRFNIDARVFLPG